MQDFDAKELAIIGLSFIGSVYVGCSVISSQPMQTEVIIMIVMAIIAGGSLKAGEAVGANKVMKQNGDGLVAVPRQKEEHKE